MLLSIKDIIVTFWSWSRDHFFWFNIFAKAWSTKHVNGIRSKNCVKFIFAEFQAFIILRNCFWWFHRSYFRGLFNCFFSNLIQLCSGTLSTLVRHICLSKLVNFTIFFFRTHHYNSVVWKALLFEINFFLWVSISKLAKLIGLKLL